MADFLFLKQRVTVWFAALYRHRVVSDVKDTKFESNSQLMPTAEQAQPEQIQQPQTEQAQQTTEITAPTETIDVPQTEATADAEQRTQEQQQSEQAQVVEPTAEQVEAEQDEKGKAAEKPKWYDEAMNVIRDKNGYVTDAELEEIVQSIAEAAENDDLSALAKQINEGVIDLSSNKSGIAEKAYKKEPTEANRRAYIKAQITDAIGDIVSDRVNNVLQRYPIAEMTQDELQNEFDFLYSKIGRDKAASLQLRQKDIANLLGRNNTNASHNERKKDRTAAAQEREALQEQRRMDKEAEKRSREEEDKALLAEAKQYTEDILGGSLTDDGRLDDFVVLETKRKYPTFIFVPKSKQQAYEERFGYKQVEGAFEIVYDEKGEPAGILCKNRKALIGHDGIATGANVRLEYLFDSTGRRLKATNEEQKVENLKKFYKAETLEAILDSRIPTNNNVLLREILAMDSPDISNLCKDIYLKHPEMFKNVDESEAVETLRSRIKEDVGALNVLIGNKGLFQFGKGKQNMKRLENYLNPTATMGQESNRNEINQKNYDREIAEYKQKRMLGEISQEEYDKVRNKLLKKYPHERTDSKDKAAQQPEQPQVEQAQPKKAAQKILSQAEANALRDELDLLESTRDEQPDLFTLDDKKRMDEINELLKDAPADTRYEDYEFSIVSDSEAAEIRRRAEADGTFMRAPNGKPTNLTERQWLQVRTRAFKEWFGDWEKAARIEKLKHSESIVVSGEEYKGQYELNSKSAEEYIINSLRGSYTNKDTDNVINITRASRKVAHHDAENDIHLRSIAYIPQMIENAIFIDEQSNEKGSKFDTYRYYVVGLKINGVDYTAKMVVGQKNGESYYDHSLTQIEKNNLINLTDGVKADVSGKDEAVESLGKDKRLISILQTNSSKVVDENGEPLVVYHGTTNDETEEKWNEKYKWYDTTHTPFTIFRRKVDGVANNGIFFNSNMDNAFAYGYYNYSVYLSMRNPLVIDCNNRSYDAIAYNEEIKDTYEWAAWAEEKGYDGVIFENIRDGVDLGSMSEATNDYVAFSPSQIKSATDNIGTFDGKNDDIRFDRRNAETEADTAARREATEAVLQLLRDAGIKVELVDESALWDMADAALEAKRKRSAPETALPADESAFKGTAISSADGAKVLKNIDTLAKDYEILTNNSQTFLGDLAQALGAERKGSSSRYATFETKNGQIVTIRLANHNASTVRMDNAGNDNAISIVISRKPNEGVEQGGEAHVVEFFYPDKALRKADGKPLAAIARSIGQALYSGEYTDTTGLAEREEVNVPQMSIRTYHGSGADFTAFDHSHMGEGEGAQAYGWGTYVTEVEGIGKTYAETNAHKSRELVYLKSEYGSVDSNLYYTRKGLKEEKEELPRLQKRYDEAQKKFAEFNSEAERLKNEYGEQSPEYRNHLFNDIYTDDFNSAKRSLEDCQTAIKWREEERIPELERELDDLSRRIKAVEQNTRHLYTVEIPDDNGSNYLSWDKPLSEQSQDRIDDIDNELYNLGWHRSEVTSRGANSLRFTKDGEMIEFSPETTGDEFYRTLKNAFGSDKAASEFLNSLGFTGIKYPAEYQSGGRADGASNYVVFNESDLHITDHVQWLRGRDGVAYGAAVGDRIILNRERLNPNTPIHEYTHLWDAACRRTNPELWRRGVELMQQTSLWDEVKNDPNYSHLQSDDAIASEVHSRLAGRDGAALLDRLQREANTENAMDMVEHLGLVARLKRWLHDFWQWTKDTFAPWSTAEAARVTTDDFVLMPLADLVRGKNPSNARQLEQTNDTFNRELATLTEENADNKVLMLGNPSGVLLSAGVENKPMKLYGNKVIKKMRQHGFSLDELRDLPRAVADPIAVFNNYQRYGNRSVLTELKTEQGNFLVAISLGNGKEDIDFNIISSVFGKGDNKIVDWFEKGYATYINKEKALNYLHHSAPIAEALSSSRLSTAAKVVENFENPKPADDISFEIERATDDISGSTMPMPQQQRIMTEKWGNRLDQLYSETLYMNHILSRITYDINKARI